MTRPIPESHFAKLSMGAMTDEATTTQNRRDGDVAFPVGVGRWKARVSAVGGKLRARCGVCSQSRMEWTHGLLHRYSEESCSR